MAEKKLSTVTIAEYLSMEEESATKNEFENGLIVAMSGGTINHGIIGNNINTLLSNAVRDKKQNCIPFNGDVKVYIEQANSFVYPDGMLVCGSIDTFEKDKHSVINPVLIIEVLSKSTESYDRGDKFHKYCSLPSFREYVLIDQNKPVVDVLYREATSYWKMVTTIGLEKQIYLHTADTLITMVDIYRNAQDLATPQFRLDI